MRSASVSASGRSDRHPGPLCALHRLILTAREPAQLRRELIDFGCSQIDPGSRIEIGGYSEQREQQDLAREQFRIGDCRPLDDVVSELLQMGEILCWCTACYRKGRTGEHFIEFAIPGFITRFCTPNALLTLQEYLCEYASAEVQTSGASLIVAELAKLPEDASKSELLSRLAAIEQGQRDLYF
jgi:2-iminoacetate synthase